VRGALDGTERSTWLAYNFNKQTYVETLIEFCGNNLLFHFRAYAVHREENAVQYLGFFGNHHSNIDVCKHSKMSQIKFKKPRRRVERKTTVEDSDEDKSDDESFKLVMFKCFTVNSLHRQFAPVTNSPHVNMGRGRVGIQRYQPNFWRLTRLTSSLLQFSTGKGLPLWRTGGDYWDALVLCG